MPTKTMSRSGPSTSGIVRPRAASRSAFEGFTRSANHAVVPATTSGMWSSRDGPSMGPTERGTRMDHEHHAHHDRSHPSPDDGGWHGSHQQHAGHSVAMFRDRF